jgi:GTP-binding protein YchF
MSLRVGIVGLPNVGKSTLLNALTKAGAEASNYPFTTIDKNIGVALVPDPRLNLLAQKLQPQEVDPATVEFVDIAGLVKGASHGEGLGNKFLGHIREVDALAQVVRCFEDENVAHVHGKVEPGADIGIVEAELLLADLDRVERFAEKIRKQAKAKPDDFRHALELLDSVAERLKAGQPARGWPNELQDSMAHEEHLADLNLLTGKPVLVVANVAEDDVDGEPWVGAIRDILTAGEEVIPIPVKLEAEVAELSPEEAEEFLKELGMGERGLDRLVRASARLLNLITFYTIANEKLRAWHILKGTRAVDAAGKIHTDMAKGFIRVEVMGFSDLMEHGSRAELHHHGLIRTEGKDYEVQDGDVCQVLFKA